MTPKELKRIRVRAGLSQSALARKFGLANSRTVRRYEAGEFVPPGPVIRLYEMLRAGELK